MLVEQEDGRYKAESSSLATEEIHMITEIFHNVLSQLQLAL